MIFEKLGINPIQAGAFVAMIVTAWLNSRKK